MTAISTYNLTKIYKSNIAVIFKRREIMALNNLTLEVKKGEIFGFLGPNGSGKTTTIKLLLGLIFPTGGNAMLLGKPIKDLSSKHRIGYLPEGLYYYPFLKADETLHFCGSLFKMTKSERLQRIEQVLQLVGLQEHRNVPLSTFSKGMLQRIGIAQTLFHDPELLILDEPTSGLDPIARKEMRDIILNLKSQGKTIFFSSHELSEVEMICDRVGILKEGRLIAQGSLNELLDEQSRVEIIIERINETIVNQLAEYYPRYLKQTNQYVLTVENEHHKNRVIDIVRNSDGKIYSITPIRGRLEDLFVKLVKE